MSITRVDLESVMVGMAHEGDVTLNPEIIEEFFGPESYDTPGISLVLPPDDRLVAAFFRLAHQALGEAKATRLANKKRTTWNYNRAEEALELILYFPGVTLAK